MKYCTLKREGWNAATAAEFEIIKEHPFTSEIRKVTPRWHELEVAFTVRNTEIDKVWEVNEMTARQVAREIDRGTAAETAALNAQAAAREWAETYDQERV
jgi:hypothetical protein